MSRYIIIVCDSKNFVLEDFIYQEITVLFDNCVDINVMKFAILSVNKCQTSNSTNQS
jgi:hypothetical protein